MDTHTHTVNVFHNFYFFCPRFHSVFLLVFSNHIQCISFSEKVSVYPISEILTKRESTPIS